MHPYAAPTGGLHFSLARLERYGVALFAAAVALVLHLSAPLIGEVTPFLLVLTAVAALAWYGGLILGLLGTLLAALGLATFVLLPDAGLTAQERGIRLAVFVLMAGSISAVIEGKKRAEAARRRSEGRFRAIFEHAPVGIGQVGLDDGRLLEANPVLCEILGYARAELLGRSFTEITFPDDRRQEEALLALLRAGKIPSFTLEKRYLRQSGEPLWVRVTSSLPAEPEKEAEYRISVIEDISERRRAQETRQFLAEVSDTLASSLEYQTTLERVARLAVPAIADWCAVDMVGEDGTLQPVAVAHADPARIEWARELRRRYPPDPALGHGVPQVLRTGRPELYTEIPATLLAEAARDDAHLQILRQMGLSSAIIVPLMTRGRTLGAITLIAAESGRRYGPEDLATAEELARRAAIAIDNARLFREIQEADREKETFLAMLGHELRTPLGIINNSLHLLGRHTAGHEQAERLRARIDRQAQRMGRLVDDLQDASRIGGGKLALQRERLDLARLIAETVEDQRPALEDAGLRLVLELPPEPVAVEGDPARLAQVLVNLVNNAMKFSDAGGTVTVRLTRDGEHACVSVRDTGVGIAPEMLPHVFKSFAQEVRSLDRSRGGLGLGLALVKGLVELHGGEVGAASGGSGQGTEVSFRLPVSPPPAAGLTP